MPFCETGAISKSATGGGQNLSRRGARGAPGTRPLHTHGYGGMPRSSRSSVPKKWLP